MKSITSKLLVSAFLVAAFTAQSNALPRMDNTKNNSGLLVDPIASKDGKTLFINQSGKYAKVHWDQFDTAAGETVKINQSGKNDVIINKVTGPNATNFLGTLTAKGKVVVQNDAGVTFGAGSQVNVGSLVATTAKHFEVNPDGTYTATNFNKDAGVNFNGNVNADNGYVYALAKNITVGNGALVQANNGNVQLQSGAKEYTLDLRGDGKINYSAEDSKVANVDVAGTVRAEGGDVVIRAKAADVNSGVINLAGVIDTSELGGVTGGRAGNIVANSSGNLNLASNNVLDASGAYRQGGNIRLNSDAGNVGLNGNVDTSAISKKAGDVKINSGGDIYSNAAIDSGSSNNIGGNIKVIAAGAFNDGASSDYYAHGNEGGGNVHLAGDRQSNYGLYDQSSGKSLMRHKIDAGSNYNDAGRIRIEKGNKDL